MRRIRFVSLIILTFGLFAETDVQSASNSWSGGMVGSIAWEAGGRSGTCSVNVEYSGSSATQDVTFTMSGTVCGASISRSFSVG